VRSLFGHAARAVVGRKLLNNASPNDRSFVRAIAMSQQENEGGKDDSVRRCYPGWCSFCRRNYRDVGPLAEGADLVYICYECLGFCTQIINDACRDLGKALPWTTSGRDKKDTGDEPPLLLSNPD
jgi:hypothetical protein